MQTHTDLSAKLSVGGFALRNLGLHAFDEVQDLEERIAVSSCVLNSLGFVAASPLSP